MRCLFGFLCVCALGVVPLVGCSETGGIRCQDDFECQDSNACTEDYCENNGMCVNAPIECADDFNDCTAEACNPAVGCEYPPIADGTPCDGGACQAGVCDLTGTVLPCTEQGIRNAIAAGGEVPYTFECGEGTTVTTKAEIEIDNDVILDGEGNLTVDGNESHRLFSVAEGVTAELRGFAISKGVAPSAGLGSQGGGIANRGTLTMTNCTVSGNAASLGAGVFNLGTLTMTNSTVSGNVATSGAYASSGGGIYNQEARNALGVLTMTNCTVSGNEAFLGGGISNAGTMSITNSTVSANTSDATSGDIWNLGDLTLTSSLMDGDCVTEEEGAITSLGYNIESPGDTCGFDPDGTDLVNVPDPMLGPLQDNGGPTWTHALLPGSPAINQIPEAACEVETDQRGKPRPETGGTMCDVGAFERQPDDPQRALDLLILIDDSASMRDEQDKFAEQMPRLVNLLLTGGAAEPTAVGEFPEVESLHVGIITPDLGWSTEPMTSYSPPGDFNPTAACEKNNGNGKAGFMQVEGLRGEPRVPCQAQTPPEGTLYLNYPEPGFTAADLISDVECVTGQSDGCGFEQQLEAILASDRNTANGGFSREGALLAIILITDEDDCSTTDPRVFDVEPRPGNPYQGPFTSMNEVQFNLRCWAHSQALQQIQRYVDSIADLKGDPSQVVFAAITGIPEDSALDRENFNSDEERYDAILAADAMQEVPDPSTDDTQRQQLTPACTATDGSGSAAPGRRIVETMRGLAADNTGVGTVVESICAADYAPALNAIVDRIAAALRRH